MKTFLSSVKRNTTLFFKDKGLFFTSLITPLILLVLYITFLSNVFRDSFNQIFSAVGETVSDKLISSLVGGQLMSSLLAVSCITVSFCSNMLMVQDKVNGAYNDLMMTPLKRSTLALSYYLSTLISTLIVCFFAFGICLIYIACVGWYLSLSDVLFLLLDIFLLVMFGTALSSIVNFFLSSQGQISAVGSIVSSCYGFICGAYMPLATFGAGLKKVVMFLPGTYGTSLIRNHSLNATIDQMAGTLSPESVTALRDSIDCNIYFFENQVSVGAMYLVVGLTTALLILAYVLINKYCRKKIK